MISRATWESRVATLGGPMGNLVRRLWARLGAIAPGRYPQCTPFPREEGSFELTWNGGPLHLDVEVWPDGRLDWLYYDRETSRHVFDEGAANAEGLLAHLEHLAPVPPENAVAFPPETEDSEEEMNDPDVTRPLSEEETTGLRALLATMSETVAPPSSQEPCPSDFSAGSGDEELYAGPR